MNQHRWEKAWQDKTFVITTGTPSVLVSRYADSLEPGDMVLDVGCGNGRNSVFLAGRGCFVKAFDVADLEWRKILPPEVQDKIEFKKTTVLEYPYEKACYQAIVVARVIQYLNSEELSFLLQKIKEGLTQDGFLLLSYNTKGGIFNRTEIDVPTNSRPIEEIEKQLREIFSYVTVTAGSSVSTHVNYSDTILTYDIWASNSPS